MTPDEIVRMAHAAEELSRKHDPVAQAIADKMYDRVREALVAMQPPPPPPQPTVEERAERNRLAEESARRSYATGGGPLHHPAHSCMMETVSNAMRRITPTPVIPATPAPAPTTTTTTTTQPQPQPPPIVPGPQSAAPNPEAVASTIGRKRLLPAELSGDEEEEEDDEPKTKEGYEKDGFVVDSEEEEEEDDPPQKPQPPKKKWRLDHPLRDGNPFWEEDGPAPVGKAKPAPVNPKSAAPTYKTSADLMWCSVCNMYHHKDSFSSAMQRGARNANRKCIAASGFARSPVAITTREEADEVLRDVVVPDSEEDDEIEEEEEDDDEMWKVQRARMNRAIDAVGKKKGMGMKLRKRGRRNA